VRHIVRAAFVTIVILAAPAAARAELVEEIIAWVNGEIITFSDYEREKESAIAEAYRSLQGRELDEWLTDVDKRILLDMIDRKILVHHAQSLGYNLDTMGDAMFENFKDQQNVEDEEAFLKSLEAQGLTIDIVKDRLISMYAPQEVINFEVTNRLAVSDREIEIYYGQNPEQFVTPGEVSIREIVLRADSDDEKDDRRAEAASAHERVTTGGEDFVAVVKELSEAGTRANGGLLGPLKGEDLSPQLAANAFELAVGEISEVMETPYGFHIIYIESRRDRSVLSLDEVREQLREFLEDQAFSEQIAAFMTRMRDNSEWCVKPKYEHLLAIPARTECQAL